MQFEGTTSQTLHYGAVYDPDGWPQFQAHEFVVYLRLHGLHFRQAVKSLVRVLRFAVSVVRGNRDL